MKRIRKSRAARILSWMLTVVMIAPILLGVVTPRPAYAQQAGNAPSGNLLTVIVIDFANKANTGGDALARFATDAVAVEMASSARFEVLKREEVLRTANELGYRPPYDQTQLLKIANTLGANAIVTGEVALVRVDPGHGSDKNVRVGMKVRVLDASSGELLNGAAVVGQGFAKPGMSDTDALTQEATSKAAVQSVKQILAFTLPEGIILNTVGQDIAGLQILINRGSRDGLAEGMEMVVYRDHQRVGKIKVTRVFPTDSEARVVENIQGFRPQDTVRAVFPMPELDINSATVRPSRARTSSSLATLGKVLLVVLIGVIIATTLKTGGSVTGVTAEPDLQSGSPAVQLTWRDNLFSGQTLEYHVWRQPEQPFNFTGVPIAATSTRQYTDRPAPYSYWDGVRTFLRAPAPGSSGGSGTGGTTNSVATPATPPVAGSVPGFIAGRTYVYQITAVVRRTVATSNNTSSGGGGTPSSFVVEDVETGTVNSGPATPINQPQLGTPGDQSANIDLRNVNFTFQSVAGADVFQVEISTDPFFKDRTRIVQLPLVYSTSPLNDGATQTIPAPIDLRTNATLRKDLGFFNFVTGVPGAARPKLYWRVGARNNNDRPGPVHNITRNPKDEDRSFRFIYSPVRSFTPADIPPPPP